MNLHWLPQMRDDRFALEVAGEVLTVDGVAFDFAPLGEGETLPCEAIAADWFCGATRTDGVLQVSILLPHAWDAPEAVRFPQPSLAVPDGPVTLP